MCRQSELSLNCSAWPQTTSHQTNQRASDLSESLTSHSRRSPAAPTNNQTVGLVGKLGYEVLLREEQGRGEDHGLRPTQLGEALCPPFSVRLLRPIARHQSSKASFSYLA